MTCCDWADWGLVLCLMTGNTWSQILNLWFSVFTAVFSPPTYSGCHLDLKPHPFKKDKLSLKRGAFIIVLSCCVVVFSTTCTQEKFLRNYKRWMDETWRGSVCLYACNRWAPVISKPEIMWRENWISLENNRMRMLMSFSANVWEAKTNIFSPFVLLTLSPPFPHYSCQLSSFLFPVFHPSLSSVRFSSIPNCCPQFPTSFPLTTVIFSMLLANPLPLFPAEKEDHHHLRGGEEVSAQIHHRSKRQHTAGDPGGYGGVCGDAPSGLRLWDHHPQGRAWQAGTSAHAGVRKGEEERGGGGCITRRVKTVIFPLFETPILSELSRKTHAPSRYIKIFVWIWTIFHHLDKFIAHDLIYLKLQ